MMKSPWGSDDPTKAAFPFSHADALAEARHDVQIFLLGEAVVLMRRSVAEAVTPVGFYACGTSARARVVTDADLANWNAKYGKPKIFVSLVEWADRVITEESSPGN